MRFRDVKVRIAKVSVDIAPVLARDGIGIAGACSISYGAWLWFEPAGFIIGGAFCLAAAWLLGRGAAEE